MLGRGEQEELGRWEPRRTKDKLREQRKGTSFLLNMVDNHYGIWLEMMVNMTTTRLITLFNT